MPLLNPTCTVLLEPGIAPLQHSVPCRDPQACKRVVPKMAGIFAEISRPPRTREVTELTAQQGDGPSGTGVLVTRRFSVERDQSGQATVAQMTLVEVIATSTLFAELIEREAFQHHGGVMPERLAMQHGAYLNARSRAARQLGLRPAQGPATSFAELFAADAEDVAEAAE